jgi:hypothetical protein
MKQFQTVSPFLLVMYLTIGSGMLWAANINEYPGLWRGEGTYVSVNEIYHFSMLMNLSLEGNLLAGELTVAENEASISIQGPVVNGVFVFPYPNDSPGHPDCLNWNVTGRAYLDAAGTTMTLVLSGIFCGEGGGQPGKFTGTLRRFALNTPMMLLLDKDQP